ncbi:dual specificity protein phosphatase 22 isoform X3 [Bubalus kerabau]|uniref:dual specificity protein phosphatase 22 isoform X3 n=1 Tax=Bubalus carabanensis TaxID=3119969 RepID=UPI00244EE246|nr:dual specificity protein phosphatase 22 isoform X3 [Bubalus carabanensis]
MRSQIRTSALLGSGGEVIPEMSHRAHLSPPDPAWPVYWQLQRCQRCRAVEQEQGDTHSVCARQRQADAGGVCLPETPVCVDGGPERLRGSWRGLVPCHLSVWWPPPFLALRSFAAFPDVNKPIQGVQWHLKFKRLASVSTSLSLPPLAPAPDESSHPSELGPALGLRRTLQCLPASGLLPFPCNVCGHQMAV